MTPVRAPLALPAPGQRDEQRLRGRALALLWAVGTTLLTASILVFDDPTLEEPEVLTAVAVAYAFAAAMFVATRRLPRWTFDVFLAAGSLLIGVLIHHGGGATSAYVLFYLWQLVFAAYFLPRGRAMAQVLLAASAYTAVLLVTPTEPFAPTRWAMALSTFVVVAVLVRAVRAHVDRLVADLAAAARTDALTGLANRRTFEETLLLERRRAQRSGRPLSVLLADIDHFKQVNDHHGHFAGDRALSHLAALLRASARPADLPSRLGGEEFAVVLPETSLAEATQVAERLREKLAAALTADGIALTASFGVAQDGAGGDLLERADAALYEAKRAGRNRTVAAPSR